ncbi:GIY-YIG nuclease family protein [Pelagibius marinus]|uniref:GIY-YIG nuclease family protein n=1 Tax=Pelagibius marinus TaxID=2762760 RepID=UPI0018732360|nr:GIY-YIG nuclease family protein [Pelagibius marinus]
MTVREFIGLPFKYVGKIEPERDEYGEILELLPQERFKDADTAKLHAYGAGPFCRFRIGRGHHKPGLYVLTLDNEAVYAGECVDLAKRWGPNGYGSISPRNCFDGGQPTNCRLNAAILVAVKKGQRLDLWFHATEGSREERQAAETRLIMDLRPVWNRAKLG